MTKSIKELNFIEGEVIQSLPVTEEGIPRSWYFDEFPTDKLQILNEINERVINSLNEKKTGKYRYVNRGMNNIKLFELSKIKGKK